MKPKRLRRRLAVPLAIAFAALWLGTMSLMTASSRSRQELYLGSAMQKAGEELARQEEQYYYNIDNGLGDRAIRIMENNLSGASYYLTDVADGGMALYFRAGDGAECMSQLAYGYGNEDGVDLGRRWYLRFDEGLDGPAQIAFAEWLVENRWRDYSFCLYPADSWYHDEAVKDGEVPMNCDGTYLRVTGEELPGSAVNVKYLDLVHPGGETERVLETALEGADYMTVELKYVSVTSVLLPAYGSGGDGPVNMERRLANFTAAQAAIAEEAGSAKANYAISSVRSSGFRLTGGSGSDGAEYVAANCDLSAAAMAEQTPLYISSFILAALIVLLLSRALARRVTEPAEALSAQAAESGRCDEAGPVTELNSLARAFNAAQERVSAQLERERDFTRAAAHELKTPLAILRAHAEALREDISPDKRAQYLGIVLDESDAMAALVAQLLELSRLEGGAQLEREAVDFAELVRGVWQPMELQLEEKGISLRLELEEITLNGDKRCLSAAVGNLASNALRYCRDGGEISVALAREGDMAVLSVANCGEPIPERELERIWEPFYRGDKSRSRESGGTGLGLAIVRAAVKAHGGRTQAQNSPAGPVFTLKLPI